MKKLPRKWRVVSREDCESLIPEWYLQDNPWQTLDGFCTHVREILLKTVCVYVCVWMNLVLASEKKKKQQEKVRQQTCENCFRVNGGVCMDPAHETCFWNPKVVISDFRAGLRKPTQLAFLGTSAENWIKTSVFYILLLMVHLGNQNN